MHFGQCSEKRKFQILAGIHLSPYIAKRTYRRNFAKKHGRIIVKRDQFMRDYKGETWRIRHFCNGTKDYNILERFWW